MASFVCGDDTGLFKVVNAETGEVEQTLGSQGPEQGITVLEWTSDQHEQLIVGRITGEVEVYDYKEEVVMVAAGAATGTADPDGGNGKNKKNSAAAAGRGTGRTVDSDDEHQEDDMLEAASDEEEEEEEVESDDELSEELDEDQEASASRRKRPKAGVEKAAENAGAAATAAKHKQPNKLAKRKVGRFDVEPVFRVKLSLIRNKRDPTKNEKLVFACRLGDDDDGAAADDQVKLQGRLLVLSSLGNGWILDTDKTQHPAVAGRGALDVLQQQGEQPAPLKSSFVLPGNFIDPNDKKWQTSIKPRPCLKMAHYRHFEVAADVVDAGGAAAGGAKPAAQHQLAYCGIENDIRIVDLATNKELWKAKNLPNDKLDLKVPIVYTRLHWAPKVLGCSTAIIAFTMDARVRIFDTKRQPRALFDFPIVYKRERSSGHSGCANNSLENSRPVTSSFLSGSCLAVVGDTVGNIDVLDLRGVRPYLSGAAAGGAATPTETVGSGTKNSASSSCTSASSASPPGPASLVKEIPKIGSVAHLEYIHKKGLIRYLGACTPYGAAIRGLCQLADSKQVVAVGLGRFAVVQRGLEGSGTRRICDRRVYLKQKLNCLLPMPSVVPDADDAGAAGRGDEVEEVGDLSEDSADGEAEEEENSNEDEISDIASELSYGSYVQEFDDDSEEESEAPAPTRKKRKTNKRK